MKHRILGWVTFAVITVLSLILLWRDMGVGAGVWFAFTGVCFGAATWPWQRRQMAWMGEPFGWFMWVFFWPVMVLYCQWLNETRKIDKAVREASTTPALRRAKPRMLKFKHPSVLSLQYAPDMRGNLPSVTPAQKSPNPDV